MEQFEKDRQKILRKLKLLKILSKNSFLLVMFGLFVYPFLAILLNIARGEDIMMVMILSLLCSVHIFEVEVKFKDEFRELN